MSKLNSDQAQNATANTWASCYPTRPPVPMHAALDSTHPSTRTDINPLKCGETCVSTCGGACAWIPVLWIRAAASCNAENGRYSLSVADSSLPLSLSGACSRSISLSSFPFAAMFGAGRGLGLGVQFGGEERSVKERKEAQGDKKAIRGQSSLTSRRNV